MTILFLTFAIMTAAVPVQASKPKTYTIYPNGHDDTKSIQAALDACAGIPGCKIQLEKGTFYISQIAAYDFQGTFLGRGEKWTTIQALSNLPSPAPKYNTPESPFWGDCLG